MTTLHLLRYSFDDKQFHTVLPLVPDGVYKLYMEKIISAYNITSLGADQALREALLEYQGPLE